MRRNYGGYTRIVKQKVQSFFDIQTSSTSATVLKFNAGGQDILKRLPGFFSSFKYYKLGNLKITAVPQSTLPVDPTGLSYEEGEQFVDPRDQLTPGLIRITNGEDMRGFSANFSRSEFNAMMLDPRWYKFMLQSGFKRSCTPKFWGVGMLHQDAWPGSVQNLSSVQFAGETDPITVNEVMVANPTGEPGGTPSWSHQSGIYDGSSDLGLFQTGQKIRMGWMPTDAYRGVNGLLSSTQMVNTPAECQCITVVLPQQFKTIYYYRVFVTETVYFKDPVVFSQDGSFLPIDFQLTPQISTDLHTQPMQEAKQTYNDGDSGGVN